MSKPYAKAVVSASGSGPLEVLGLRCDAVAGQQPQALAVTYWLHPAAAGTRYCVEIIFTGRRRGPGVAVGGGDRFKIVEPLDVVPGSGPLALTAHIDGVAAGDWHVTAREVRQTQRRGATSRSTAPKGAASSSMNGSTTYGPIAAMLAPGARLGAWPAFVGLGWVVALVVQGLLAAHLGLREAPLLTVVASMVGLLGAKAYYATGHFLRGERRPRQLLGGSCIQGFVLASVASLVIGAQLGHLPLGALLDTTAPALMFGMAIGRYGCFFGGCCAGRPTASRWGLWSSDRRLGARRIPVQILESLLALAVGVAGLVTLWLTRPSPDGLLFVASIAAYTFGRNLLFPCRAKARYTAHGRQLMLASSGILVFLSAALGLMSA